MLFFGGERKSCANTRVGGGDLGKELMSIDSVSDSETRLDAMMKRIKIGDEVSLFVGRGDERDVGATQ